MKCNNVKTSEQIEKKLIIYKNMKQIDTKLFIYSNSEYTFQMLIVKTSSTLSFPNNRNNLKLKVLNIKTTSNEKWNLQSNQQLC